MVLYVILEQVRARINADLQRTILGLDLPYELEGFLTQIFTKMQPNNNYTMDHGAICMLKILPPNFSCFQ